MLHVLQKNLAFSVKCRIRRAQTKYCRSQWRRGVCWRRSEGGREKNVVSLQHVSNPKEEGLPWGPPEDIGQKAFGKKRSRGFHFFMKQCRMVVAKRGAGTNDICVPLKISTLDSIYMYCVIPREILLEVYFLPWDSYLFQIIFDGVGAAQWRGGGLGSRPKKMYAERLGDGVEYHLMKPTPRR